MDAELEALEQASLAEILDRMAVLRDEQSRLRTVARRRLARYARGHAVAQSPDVSDYHLVRRVLTRDD